MTWLSVGAFLVFVAVYTEQEIRVRTQKRTVLINANFWPFVQHPHPYCTTITSRSVPFLRVPGFPASHYRPLSEHLVSMVLSYWRSSAEIEDLSSKFTRIP